MNAAVKSLLASVSSDLRYSEIKKARPDLIPLMRRWGWEWEDYAREARVPCPPALVELADAMADLYIHVDDEHGWDLLTPESSREERRVLSELALEFSELVDRAQMMPVFGQDGDLFLLARDGRIHSFTHDDWENDNVALATFDELLHTLAERAARRQRAGDTPAG